MGGERQKILWDGRILLGSSKSLIWPDSKSSSRRGSRLLLRIRERCRINVGHYDGFVCKHVTPPRKIPGTFKVFPVSISNTNSIPPQTPSSQKQYLKPANLNLPRTPIIQRSYGPNPPSTNTARWTHKTPHTKHTTESPPPAPTVPPSTPSHPPLHDTPLPHFSNPANPHLHNPANFKSTFNSQPFPSLRRTCFQPFVPVLNCIARGTSHHNSTPQTTLTSAIVLTAIFKFWGYKRRGEGRRGVTVFFDGVWCAD